jgi:uncharacterized protein
MAAEAQRRNVMQFAVIARDKAGALENRISNRPEHLDHMRMLKSAGQLIEAAAILDDGGAMAGSVMLFDVADRAELDAILARDVFARAGVWDTYEILPVRRAQL